MTEPDYTFQFDGIGKQTAWSVFAKEPNLL
jgi:hypothetical protein